MPTDTATPRVGRSVVFTEAGTPLALREQRLPPPGAGEIVVHVELAGVCGSDPHRLAGDVPGDGQPVCFGHEAVGRVVAVGHGAVDDRDVAFSIGDRVYWSPLAPCGECEACAASRTLQCPAVVWPVPAESANAAGFQDYALVGPRSPRVRIPTHVLPERVIAFGCALPTAIAGLARLGELHGRVVVLGAGPVGLASAMLASQSKATHVVVVGEPAPRREIAMRLGASATIPLADLDTQARHDAVLEALGGQAADFVIEAAGHPSAFPDGFNLLGHGGTLLILGLYSGKNAASSIDPVRINNMNLTIVGSLGTPPSAFADTVDIAAEHGERLRFEDLITHRFGLQDTETAIRSFSADDAVKVVVDTSITP